MSKFRIHKPVEHLPAFEEYSITTLSLEQILATYGKVWKGEMCLDGQYWYVSHEVWLQIFADVLLNMPKYTKDRWDCDNFAFLTKCRVEEKYRLNAIAIVMGNSPFGYHAWNWFFDGLWHQLEPQTGDVFDVDENGYIADWILI